jgi:hypothetical protein
MTEYPPQLIIVLGLMTAAAVALIIIYIGSVIQRLIEQRWLRNNQKLNLLFTDKEFKINTSFITTETSEWYINVSQTTVSIYPRTIQLHGLLIINIPKSQELKSITIDQDHSGIQFTLPWEKFPKRATVQHVRDLKLENPVANLKDLDFVITFDKVHIQAILEPH